MTAKIEEAELNYDLAELDVTPAPSTMQGRSEVLWQDARHTSDRDIDRDTSKKFLVLVIKCY